MGGAVPLGYDPAPGGARTLTINESEAALVRRIFQTYLELGSVHALKDQLKTCGTRSKINVTAKGRTRGGVFFSRGSLFHLLRNRLYRGQITHKGKVHPGLHTAIIDEEIFDAVQLKLSSQTRRINASKGTVAHSPLTGRIFDADGNPMSPTSTYGRHGTLYRYYVSAPLQQGTKRPLRDDQPRRVSASALEQQLTERLTVLLPDEASNKILDLILRLTVRSTSVTINLSLEHLSLIQNRLLHGESVSSEPHNTNGAHLTLPWHLSTKSGKTEITTGQRQSRQADPVLIRALRKAHALLHRDNSGLPMLNTAPDTPHRYRIIRLAFLAPDIQQAILAGRQPREMTLASLLDGKFPIVWADQRRILGMDLQHR